MKTKGKSTELEEVTRFIADARKLSDELREIIVKAEAERAKLIKGQTRRARPRAQKERRRAANG